MTQYEIIDFNGQQARLYPNGDIRNERGQVLQLAQNRLASHAITSENAKDYHRMRKEKTLRAIEEGVMRVTEAPNPAEAIARIVSKRASIAMTDETRVGNDAAKIVLLAMDALQDRKQETVQTQVHEYKMDEDTLRIVEQMIAQRRGENIQENIIDIE